MHVCVLCCVLFSPLSLCCARVRVVHVVLCCVDLCGLNGMVRQGWTPLYAASLNGHEAVVRYLVEQEADVHKAMNIVLFFSVVF